MPASWIGLISSVDGLQGVMENELRKRRIEVLVVGEKIS